MAESGKNVFADRDAVVKLWDETANTPLSVTGSFMGNLDLPLGRMRPEQQAMLNNGKADGKHHFITLTDEELTKPVECSFGGLLYHTDTTDDFLIALGNPFQAGTWQPGGTSTFSPVTAANLGSFQNADDTAVNFPGPDDAVRVAGLVHMGILWDGASDWGLQGKGLYVAPGNVRVSKGENGPSSFAVSGGEIWGEIVALSAFPTLTEIS